MRQTFGRQRLPQDSLKFVHLPTGEYCEDIWQHLWDNCHWKQANYKIHEENTFAGAANPSSCKSLLRDYTPVLKGQVWCDDKQIVIDPSYSPRPAQNTLNAFLAVAEAFFASFDGKKIGVQLSGGLDSSLIIGLLKHFNIPHALIGLRSERYEFRTERYIQELLAAQNADTILIDESICLPFSGINAVPPHQLPDLLSLNYAQGRVMGEACQHLGVEVLLSGDGGDALLGQSVPGDRTKLNWCPQHFTAAFLADLVYRPRDVTLISFFSALPVVDSLYHLRRGQSDDYSKRWARKFFRDFLPHELVDFTYRADFWGRNIDGLSQNLPGLRIMHQTAYELSESSYFEAQNLENLLSQDLLRPQKELYQEIEARISAAVWVYSLCQQPKAANGIRPRIHNSRNSHDRMTQQKLSASVQIHDFLDPTAQS